MRKSKLHLLSATIFALTLSVVLGEDYDLVIYGGTSASVTAAVQARKMGKSVIIVSPDKHIGGLSSGGLGWTDTGSKSVIGGLSREFYHRVWKHYEKESAWRQEKKESFGDRGKETNRMGGKSETMWIFEPSTAESIFEDFIKEYELEVIRDAWLDRSDGGVTLENRRIVSFKTMDGKVYRGKMFMDTTYEGDLLAAAKVDYHVGREAQSTYGEKWNGVQTGVLHHQHHFNAIPDKIRIDPYLIKGDPKSGVLPGISAAPPGAKGSADSRVQAYCFRMCLTNAPSNRIPFPKPANYDAKKYELLGRIFDAGWTDVFHKFDPLPNHKTDTNNHGPMSTDNIGKNYDYPDASYQRRREIIAEHKDYQQGWLYYIANDPRVPEDIRKEMNTWGLPKDEFEDNGNWSHQLYIREARRMQGQFVMTENEILKKAPTPKPIGMGSYTMDSHNVQRYITPEGYVQNEGDIGVKCKPYEIAYGSLVPKKEQCQNLLVPVCVSSSHIAFGSMRMEPVFMILGQSAATAAVMAIDAEVAVQDINYDKLKERLLADGQVLQYGKKASSNAAAPPQFKGIVLDDSKATLKGKWESSTSHKTYLGDGYLHDSAAKDGSAEAVFKVTIPKPGWYEVHLAYTPNANRASNVPVAVHHVDGASEMKIDQRETPQIDGIFEYLGSYEFINEGYLTISNKDTDGHVIVDGARWLPVDQ